MSYWYFNWFCSSANRSQGLRSNSLTFADTKRDADMVSWSLFWMDGKKWVFWCKSQETIWSWDMVKPRQVLTAAYKQKYILHGIAETVWITSDLLSDIRRAFLVFLIHLKIMTKICHLSKGFKITVDLCERCFATPGGLFWDCKMGQRGSSVCKWHVHKVKLLTAKPD